MVNKSERFESNVLMQSNHFKSNDKQGNKYEVLFNNSHLVNAKLIKKSEWHPFRKVGELSEEGLEFVEANVNVIEAKLWEEFLKVIKFIYFF